MTGIVLVLLSSLLGDVRPRDMVVPPGDPLAARGGVLVTRLSSTGAAGPWPDHVVVRLVPDTGPEQELVGHIGWVEPMPRNANRSWGADNLALHVRPVRPSDRLGERAPGNSPTGPRLLVSLPADASGILELGQTTITPQWVDLPESMPALRVGDDSRAGVLEAVNGPDRPAAHNPLDWWRWELIAERRGLEPPPPEFDSIVERLAARNVTGTWRLGMSRLAQASRGVAARCRDLLTATCRDDDTTVAAWVTNNVAIDRLLRVLLDPRLDDDGLAEAALAWADEQVLQFAWVEQPYGPEIRLSLANPEPRPVLAELVWTSGDDVPLGLRLPPDSAGTTSMTRPGASLARSRSRMDILNVVVRNQVLRVPFGDSYVSVTPPGPILGPFKPSLTLADARALTMPEVAPDQQCWMQLRRRDGHWELYLECLYTPVEEPTPLPTEIQALDDLVGIEAVTILLGDATATWPNQTIAMSPHDGWRRYRGDQDRPAIQLRRQADRWLATVTIPDAWIPADGEPLLLAALRTHGDRPDFETAPTPCVPWRINPRPIYLDLSAWEQEDTPSLRTAGSQR